MKLPFKLLLLTLLAGTIGCEKQGSNPEVEKYIRQLRSNSYTASELPAFKPSDIPALLEYRSSTIVISDFPHNGISSLWGPECKLGVYVLWTIESIRAVEINSKYLIGRFPSQNPILALRNSQELYLVYDAKSQNEAAKAYYEWWYSGYSLNDKMKIDPLEDTDYRWH
ncbi:MAG TPA: hypothetical protein DEO60_06140 [Bacteroidales bacterium]|jgi:hypothetical protein|nr:hypothetical protein [Bacteroidales bacterium]HBZ20687.1 hypothetical protein [Bacteroidales bacterium]